MEDGSRKKKRQEETENEDIIDIFEDIIDNFSELKDSASDFVDSIFSGADAPARKAVPAETSAAETGKDAGNIARGMERAESVEAVKSVDSAANAVENAGMASEAAEAAGSIADAAEGAGAVAEAAGGAAEAAGEILSVAADVAGSVFEGLGSL